MRKFEYSYTSLPEGKSSQYEDISFVPGQAVEARYIRSANIADNGNPFIEALPLPRESKEDLKNAYEIGIPGYRNDIYKSRNFCLRELPLLEDIRFKLNFHNSLEIENYNCLVESYRHREFLKGAQHCDKVIGRGIGATTKGYNIVGKSGSGKSAALDVLLSRYPQVINHTFEGIGQFKQITYLEVNAITNDNFRAFYQAIGKAIDQALGFTEPLYEYQINKARNLGEKSLIIEHLIELFAIGMIIVDEIELMSFNLSKENSFTGLARLSNETKVCFVLCGLDTAVKKWNNQEWTLRRSGIQIKADAYCEDYTSFQIIMKKLLNYNWLEKPLVFDNDTMQEFYKQTGGVICYIILLYERLQFDLLGVEEPVVTSEYIKKLMTKYFPELQKIKTLQKMEKDEAEQRSITLAGYRNSIHNDIDQMIQDEARNQEAEDYLTESAEYDLVANAEYIINVLKLLPEYKVYNKETILNNISIVFKRASKKNIELNREELLSLTCDELHKKRSDKRPRKKADKVPAVNQVQQLT